MCVVVVGVVVAVVVAVGVVVVVVVAVVVAVIVCLRFRQGRCNDKINKMPDLL